MRKLLRFTLCFVILSAYYMQLNAQQRYLNPIFPDVKVTLDVVYGVNATIVGYSIPAIGEAFPQALRMDLYEPMGDALTARPLILYFHTGNFLPWPQNLSASGTKRDSTCVEMCTRLAKMGYVVASVDYRIGWNPTATTKDERVFTLINAAYRGVQDASTCIRYFKKSVNELANPWKIDPAKITIMGQGTGGYIGMNTAVLDKYIKIPTASDGKFIATVGGNPVPMVIEAINGDIEGKTVGIVPPVFIPPFKAGDTLCYPNHPNYDSKFQLTVNLGGAVGDSAWIDPGHIPAISIQTTTDPFAPYKEGLVLVPVTPPLEVVKVQGSYIYQALNQQYGNNASFASSVNFIDPISKEAKKNNDGLFGLYPLKVSNPLDASPWDFWSLDTTINPNAIAGLATNPNMSKAKATAYMDTIIGFFAPRACLVLDLGCDLKAAGFISATENPLDENQVGLKFTPNPSKDDISVTTHTEYPMDRIYLYDASGKLVKAMTDINSNSVTLRRYALSAGVYHTKIHFKNGVLATQLIWVD